MDGFSGAAAVLQVIGQCAACSIALAKWIAQVRTVDARLEAFAREIANLQHTHEALQQSLQTPYFIAAAKSTNDASGQLWSQIEATMNDCHTTLVAVNRTLEKISKPSLFGKPMKQLQESLHSGDLDRYYQRIQNFNILLQLPMQMVTINLQLTQQETNQINHQELAQHIISVKETLGKMDGRIKNLRPNQTNTRKYSMSQSSTLVDAQADNAIYDNLEKYVAKAKNFISSASTVASARSTSAGSVIQYGIGNSAGGIDTLTPGQRLQINSWVDMPQNKPPTPAASEIEFAPIYVQANEPIPAPNTGINQVSLKLAQIYVENGQTDIEQEQYTAAEENFREALDLLKDHDFGQRLAVEPADIKLLLARCCFHQDKFEEAITLLQSVAAPARPIHEQEQRSDPLRMLTAEHLLGQVYLQMKDYANAEEHAQKAFKGRLERLGEQDPAFLETVQSVVAIYRAMGKEARARAFSSWLTPRETPSIKQRTASHASESINQPLTLFRSITTPTSDTQPRSINQANMVDASVNSNRLSAPTNVVTVPINRSASVPLPSPFRDDESTSTEITRSSTRFYNASPAMRRPLEPNFQAVKEIAIDFKDKGTSAGMKLLKRYDPTSRILILRSDEIKKNLKKRGSDLGLAATGQGYAPIHFFCELSEEHPAELEILIEAGVDLGAVCHKAGVPGRDPMTPLQITIEKGHTRMSSIIIDALSLAANKGKPVPDINTMYGRDGLPPLLSACRRGQVEVVAHLLEYGARVTRGFPDAWYGNSLLHDSCQRSDTQMVAMLLSYQDQLRHSASSSTSFNEIGHIGQKDKLGKTPLIYAVTISNVMTDRKEQKIEDRPLCLDLLLRHASESRDFEAILNIADNKGVNVFGYAEQEGDEEVKNLLRKYSLIARGLGPGELEG